MLIYFRPASSTFSGIFTRVFNFGLVFLTTFFALIDMLHGRFPFAVPTAIEIEAEEYSSREQSACCAVE